MNIIILFILFCNLFSLSYSFDYSVIRSIQSDILLSGISLGTSKLVLDNLKSSEFFVENSNVTRKMIHISAAPLFMSTWKFYNYKNIATLVPLISSLYLVRSSNDTSKILSRSGDSKEIFKGPLFYTIILSLITNFYWKSDPIGMISMIQLSIGDGFADIIGRKYGKTKWINTNNKKSVEGTIGFLTTSFLSSYLFLNMNVDIFPNNLNYSNLDIFIISLICSLSEVYSKLDDNISIPVSALITNYIIFSYHYINQIDSIVN